MHGCAQEVSAPADQMAVGAVWCELVSGVDSLIGRETTGKCRESDIGNGLVYEAENQSGVLTGKSPAIENREVCPSRWSIRLRSSIVTEKLLR